jgi:hypothetical protein
LTAARDSVMLKKNRDRIAVGAQKHPPAAAPTARSPKNQRKSVF